MKAEGSSLFTHYIVQCIYRTPKIVVVAVAGCTGIADSVDVAVVVLTFLFLQPSKAQIVVAVAVEILRFLSFLLDPFPVLMVELRLCLLHFKINAHFFKKNCV